MLDQPKGLEQTSDRSAGEKTEAEVISLGVLARVIQHREALGAEESHGAQIHHQLAAGPTVQLAVQGRAQPGCSGSVDLTTDPDDDHALVTVVQRYAKGTA
jgi:hypothetical protein